MYETRQHKEATSRVILKPEGKRGQMFHGDGEQEYMIIQRKSMNNSFTSGLPNILQNYSLKNAGRKSNASTVIQREATIETIGDKTFETDTDSYIGAGNTGYLCKSKMIIPCLAKYVNEGDRKNSRDGHAMMEKFDNPYLMKVYGIGEQYIYIEEIESNKDVGIQYGNMNINIDEIFQLIDSLGNTIKALHESGYTHNDIHLRNIKYTKDNQMKLIDFDEVKKIDPETKTDPKVSDINNFIKTIREAMLLYFIKKTSPTYKVDDTMTYYSLCKDIRDKEMNQSFIPILNEFTINAMDGVKGKNMEEIIQLLENLAYIALGLV